MASLVKKVNMAVFSFRKSQNRPRKTRDLDKEHDRSIPKDKLVLVLCVQNIVFLRFASEVDWKVKIMKAGLSLIDNHIIDGANMDLENASQVQGAKDLSRDCPDLSITKLIQTNIVASPIISPSSSELEVKSDMENIGDNQTEELSTETAASSNLFEALDKEPGSVITESFALEEFTSTAKIHIQGDDGKHDASVALQQLPNPLKTFQINEARDADSKSPEILVEEVNSEVERLNISGEEPKPSGDLNTSKVIVNKQSESLKKLMAYDSSSNSSSDTDEDSIMEVPGDQDKPWRTNSGIVSGSSDSDSDSTSSMLSSVSGSDDCRIEDHEVSTEDIDTASVIDADDGIRTESPVLNQNNNRGAVKKQSAVGIGELLPPLPDLSKLNIKAQEEFMHIGNISAIIGDIVTIEVISGTPTFDLDSMLFIDDGTNKKPLGPIFDVLGPVLEPLYCVRFNNEEEVKKLGIKLETKVYAAPKNDEFSRFVFLRELLKLRATDASWLNDEEIPPEMDEFSDDEKERQARKLSKTGDKRKLEDKSLERHKRYEKTMNQCNTLNTRVCKLTDAKHKSVKHSGSYLKKKRSSSVQHSSGQFTVPNLPPDFNPSIPPPLSNVYNFYQSGSATNLSACGNHMMLGGTPLQFGSFFANQLSSAQSTGNAFAPGMQQGDNLREGGHNPRSTNQRQNSENYLTNNSRSPKGAGPSSQL